MHMQEVIDQLPEPEQGSRRALVRVITLEHVTESSPFVYVAEASELGIEPGAEPPAEFSTDLGNGLAFVFDRMDANLTLTYKQLCGCVELRVFND